MGVTIDELQEKTILEGNEQIEIDVDGISYKTNLSKLKDFLTTPSGDQMHYAYEAAGAVWNASTGYWKLNGLTDITNDEMREIYSSGYHLTGVGFLDKWFVGARTRTNINRCYWSTNASLVNLCANASNMRIFYMGEGWALPTAMNWAFYGCHNMTQILGIISGAWCTDYTNAFGRCDALQYINITGLKTHIAFPHSSSLLKESLLYMIENCAEGVNFTITLHSDVYDKCQEFGEWYSEIDAALTAALDDKNTTITLASV